LVVSGDRIGTRTAAARSFVDLLPSNVSVGLVDFSGVATLRVPPTVDHDAVRSGIDELSLASGTAIGEAIFESLDALAASTASYPENGSSNRIVLLSDGTTNLGRSNDAAARAASEAGVPVSTIAFGTPDGTSLGESVPVDGDALRAIAEVTGGTHHSASTATELVEVYENIGASSIYTRHDLAPWCTGVALALLVMAGLASLLRRRQPRPTAHEPVAAGGPVAGSVASPMAPAVTAWAPHPPPPPPPAPAGHAGQTGWAPAPTHNPVGSSHAGQVPTSTPGAWPPPPPYPGGPGSR
jgi:hypothetical protein